MSCGYLDMRVGVKKPSEKPNETLRTIRKETLWASVCHVVGKVCIKIKKDKITIQSD